MNKSPSTIFYYLFHSRTPEGHPRRSRTVTNPLSLEPSSTISSPFPDFSILLEKKNAAMSAGPPPWSN